MSGDIATLGIAIDSRPVTAAHKELNKLSAAARPATAGTAALGKAAAPAAAATGKLSDSLRNAGTSIAILDGPLGGIASRFTSMSAIIGRTGLIVGAASVALSALTLTATKAVSAFQQLELEQATYEGVLRATGYSAGRTTDDIERLATAIRQTSLATEGQVRSASAIMLTFKNVTGEAFDESIRLSQDLAAVGFGSITSAAQMMGKALEDPILGLQAMRRVGVSFNETQKQQIQRFLETGQAARAQQVILDGVRQQVGGAGTAQGNTLAGAWNQLSEATNNWLENTGATIAKALGISGAIRGIANAIDDVNKRAAHAASPQGQLDTLLAERARLEANGKATRGAGGFLGGRANNERALAENAAKIAAAQYAVELDNVARAQDKVRVAQAALDESMRRSADQIQGVVQKLKKTHEDLRKTPVQREVDKALREAVEGTNRPLSESDRKDIETRARQNYFLREGNGLFQTRLGLLGAAASVSDVLRGKELEIIEARRAGARITDTEAEAIKRRAAEQAIGVAQIKTSIDAARIEAEVVGMSVGKTAEYTAAQEALNEARRNGRVLEPSHIEDIRRNAAALGEAAQAASNLRWTYENLVQGPMQTFRSEISRGATALEALKAAGVSALDAISKKLMDMAAQNLWEAAFPSKSGAGGGGLLGIISSILGGGKAASGAAAFNIGGSAGAIFHTGHGPGDPIRATRYMDASIIAAAPRYHTGVGPDERAAIIRKDESVLTPGQMRALGPASAPPVSVTIEQYNTFTNADPGSEARMRDWSNKTKDLAVQEAVAQVAKVHGNNPSYLR